MSVTPNDLTIYEQYAAEWWDPRSPRFRSLQKITPYRLSCLRRFAQGIKGKTIIDLGCGGGLMAVPLLKEGADVIGVDLSSASLVAARVEAGDAGRFICADVRDVPLSSASADLVMMADVLDHVPDYQRVIAEASRLVKSGGLVYINTINRNALAKFMAVTLGEGLGLIPRGTHDSSLFIKPRELIETCREAGLELLALEGEMPRLLPTVLTWSIHFKRSRSCLVAYSGIFVKKKC